MTKRNNHGRIQGRAGVELRKRRLALEPLCRDCLDEGRVSEAKEVDHVIPLHQGGEDIDSNTRNLCKAHHDAKTAKDMGYKLKPTYGLDGWIEHS